MGDRTHIEWTDASWTPVRARLWETQNDGSGKERIGWHCERVSDGCRNCYAETMNARLGTGRPFKPGERYREERKGYYNGEVKLFLDKKMLFAPLRWKRPRMIFVCSMTDLFASFVPDEWIDRVFAVMALCPQHTFQVLTKRPERVRNYLAANPGIRIRTEMPRVAGPLPVIEMNWPLPNIWLGTSVEDQARADERIPHLLATPAAVRFVSAEPLLGQVDLTGWLWGASASCQECPRDADCECGTELRKDIPDRIAPGCLDWVIVGGESGPGARPMHPDWARSLRDQCQTADVPFFFKQWGEWQPLDQALGETRGNREWMILDSAGGLDIPDDRWPDEDAGEVAVARVGKRRSGRILDGRTWDQMPEARA